MQRTKETLTPAEKKFISVVKNRFPDITLKEIRSLLSDTKRLMTTLQKIKSEPQYKISYKKIKKSKEVRRLVTTNLEELKKTMTITGKPQDGPEVFKNFIKMTLEKND